MPVPISRPTGTKPWGPLGYLKDLISPPGYVARGPFGSRPASAATLSGRAPTDAELRAQGYGFGVRENDPLEQKSAGRAPTDAELQAQGYGFGVREYDPLERGSRLPQRALPVYAGATPASTRGIVQGVTASGQVDRTQSDLYKQYALNPQGQFDRYFGTSEMNRYFGSTSRGAGAPKSAEEMTALASQTQAPTGTGVPLSTYYRAQSAAGRGNMPEIVEGLTQGLDTQKADAMKQWAQSNPMLAMREFNKRFPSGQPTMGSGEPSVSQSLQGTQYQGVGGQGFDTSASFSVAANAVPGPWNVQGAMVDANRGAQNLFSKQAEFTTGEGMPAFETTSDKVKAFLQGQRIRSDV